MFRFLSGGSGSALMLPAQLPIIIGQKAGIAYRQLIPIVTFKFIRSSDKVQKKGKIDKESEMFYSLDK